MCQRTEDTGGRVELTEDTTPVGEFRSSGYREPPGLVARGDGQMVRLPPLLYLVARSIGELRDEHADDDALLAAVAEHATGESGLDLTAEHIAFLVDHKLAPLGVTTYLDGSAATQARNSPLLSLRLRLPVLPAWATWRLAGAFGWLFAPPVLIVAVLAAIAADAWVLGAHDAAVALRSTLQQPASILLVLALALASTAFHECGHATACRYSGARPGAMGCGIYLVWPAFYTDITDSYRLDRTGRLRTDLGGVYFNGLSLLVLAGAYLATGYPPLLVAVLSVNIEVIQQLLPTLRFDGYYIVADLVGVPDLFRFIGPILRHRVLRRPAEPQLGLLRRRPQLVVTAWVLLIVPALAAQLTYIAIQLPDLVREDWQTIGSLIRQAAEGNVVLGVLSATIRILLLALPVAGAVVIFAQLGRMAARAVHRRWSDRLPRRVLVAGSAATAAMLVGGVAVALVPADRPPPPRAAGPPAAAPGSPSSGPPEAPHGVSPSGARTIPPGPPAATPAPTAGDTRPPQTTGSGANAVAATSDAPAAPRSPARHRPAAPETTGSPSPPASSRPPASTAPGPAPEEPPPSRAKDCAVAGLPLPVLLCDL